MANDKIEYTLTVDSSKAQSGIKKVDNAQDDLAKNTKTNLDVMNASWVKVGATIAGASVAMISITNKAIEVDRAFRLLTDSNKTLARDLSVLHDINLDISAGFVQTGQSAGMSSEQIKKMVDMSVALGRMYPHESTETFIDNLSMLNTTGEAQGYIVDVLEQKYGQIDLTTISLADKMKTLEKHTRGVNSQFNAQAGFIEQTIKGFNNLGKEFIAWITLQENAEKGIKKEVVDRVNSEYEIKITNEKIAKLKEGLLVNEKLLAKAISDGNIEQQNIFKSNIENIKKELGLKDEIIKKNQEVLDSQDPSKTPQAKSDKNRLADMRREEEKYNDWLFENEDKKNEEIYKKSIGFEKELELAKMEERLEANEAEYENYAKIKEKKDKKRSLEVDRERQTVDTYMQLGATLTSAMEVNNRKDFEKKKKMEMALSAIATARAVTQTLPNVPMAVAVGAMGAVQMGMIASQQYRELGGSVSENKPYIVGEKGPELFIPNGSGDIVPNKSLGGGSANVTVSLNVNAMDTKGFENVLNDKRNLKALTKAVASGIERGY